MGEGPRLIPPPLSALNNRGFGMNWKGFLVLASLVLVTGCIKSERYACEHDLELSGDDATCFLQIYSEQERAYYEGIGDAVKASIAERDRDAFLLLCIDYLLKAEECRKKSSVKPSTLIEFM